MKKFNVANLREENARRHKAVMGCNMPRNKTARIYDLRKDERVKYEGKRAHLKWSKNSGCGGVLPRSLRAANSYGEQMKKIKKALAKGDVEGARRIAYGSD